MKSFKIYNINRECSEGAFTLCSGVPDTKNIFWLTHPSIIQRPPHNKEK